MNGTVIVLKNRQVIGVAHVTASEIEDVNSDLESTSLQEILDQVKNGNREGEIADGLCWYFEATEPRGTKLPRYSVARWYLPPEYAGQAVEVSYGYDADGSGDIIERVYDRSDRSVCYTAYEPPESDGVEPWNGVPDLGPEIGPCEIMDDGQ